MIPANIFQTQKSLKYVRENRRLSAAMLSWAKASGIGFKYYFFDDQMCDKFMKQEFPDLYQLYSSLPLPVMKADLWRYCVIYKNGGIYADMDTVLKIDPRMFLKNSLLVGVPENKVHLCQWVFAAPAGSPIIKSVIDSIVERCDKVENMKTFNSEHFVHELTGPKVFTEGVEKWLKSEGLELFRARDKYSRYKNSKMWIFDYPLFHQKAVKHLYSGQWSDGWIMQRGKYI